MLKFYIQIQCQDPGSFQCIPVLNNCVKNFILLQHKITPLTSLNCICLYKALGNFFIEKIVHLQCSHYTFSYRSVTCCSSYLWNIQARKRSSSTHTTHALFCETYGLTLTLSFHFI